MVSVGIMLLIKFGYGCHFVGVLPVILMLEPLFYWYFPAHFYQQQAKRPAIVELGYLCHTGDVFLSIDGPLCVCTVLLLVMRGEHFHHPPAEDSRQLAVSRY